MENKFSALLDISTNLYSGQLNSSKERAIIDANNEKLRSLQEYQNQRAAAKAKYDATLIGKLGLDPDGIAGFGVNLVANAGAGALSTISGQVGSGIHTLWGGANLADIPDEALAARKHMLDGTATDAEKELLDSPVGKTQQKSSANRWQNDIEAAKATNLDRIRAVERSQRNAQGIREALDLSKYVYQNDKESLVSDLKKGAAGDLAKVSKGWDQLKDNEEMAGWGNIASGVAGSTAEIAKAALKNPKGALEYVAENAPQAIGAFIGKGVGVATNLLYGLDTYDKGLQAYSKDNGQIAPSDERTRMQLLSAAAVAAETLGDKAVVGASKIGSDLASGIGAAAGNVSRKGFKDTLLNTAKAIDNTVISRTGKATLAGAAGEYPTEGVQTWLENEVQGKESTLEDVYVGAALGAITGGTTSGGVSGVGEAGRLASTSLSKVQKIFQAAEATKAAVDTAAKTGDVSVFTAPESPAYSPSKALSALHEFNQLDTTDNDTRDANVVKGMEILGTMEDGLRALKAQTPQGKQEIKQDLDKLKAKMAATDPADTQALNGLKQKATKLEELMATPLAKDTEVKQLNQKIQSQVKEIEAANDLHGKMADFALEKLIESLDLDAELATADAPVDVSDTAAVAKSDAAAQNIITLSMVHRDRVTPEQAKQLADNTSNGLSESARSYFRAFSEAKVAELEIKDMGKVSQDVFYGDAAKNQMGIPQYRTRVNSALASGNQRVANRTLDMLDNFVTSHTSKLSFAQEALKKANETGGPVSVARTKQGTWEFLPQPFPTEKARRNNGGVTIDPGNKSLGMIVAIGKEAKALQAAQGELQAAYTLKFNPTKATAPVAPAAPVTQPTQSVVAAPEAIPATEPTIQPTAPTVEETTNVDQAPEAVQATQEGQQEEVTGSSVTGTDQTVNEPESSSDVTPEESVDLIDTPEEYVENQPENEQVDPAPEVESDSRLGAFKKPVVEGVPFKKRELVASDLKQTAGGELSTTRRPLAATKDFLSKWYESSGEVLNDFLENSVDTLSDHQKDLLNLFRDKARDWAPAFQASVGKKDASKRDYYFQDLMQFLLESKMVDGKEVHELEENVKTAMSFAVFSYIGEQAAKPAFNDDEAINKILNREKEHPVSKDEYELLFDKGTREANVINLLGQRAVAALGITAKKSANKDTLSRLQVAMGVHAMRVMVDQGILERGTVNGLAFSLADGSVKDYSHLPVQYRDQIAEMVNKPELLAGFKIADVDTSGLDKDTRAKVLQAFRSLKSLYEVKHNFLKIKRNADLKLLPQTEVIYRASVGSQGILGKLFSVETGLKEPSLTPIPYNQMNTKGTKRWVPEVLASILNKMSQEANNLKEDHWILWHMLGRDSLLEMGGKKSTSKATTHISERKGIEAKNDALIREIENFDLFLQNIIQPKLDENPGMRINDIDIFFEYEAWKQQRVGLATNLINPQTSKIHRAMLARKSWKTQVDPKNQDQLNNFMLRVAEGFGIKTDRMDMESALAEVGKKLKDPKIEAAVQAIIDTVIKQGDMTDDLNKAVVAGVKAGGEKFHSMDTLIALARYKHADGKPFPTELMGEIDGVTNGPMLTHLLLGAANSVKDLFARINRGGFFQNGSKYGQYNVWRNHPEHKDLYESLTRDIQAEAQKLMDANPSLSYLWDAVYKFTGDLGDGVDRSTPDGRNFVKTPLTALIFGSSPYRSKLRTADKFVTGIYSKLAKLDEAKDAERFLTIKAINNLIGNKAPRLPMNLTVAQLRETEFSKEQLKAITGAFNYTLGSAVQEVMKTSFKPLIDRRDSFNQSAELAYTLYSSVYQAKRKEFLKKLMAESGDVTKSKDPTKDGEALHDLTEEQEAELRRSLVNMFPALQTLMSLDSKQSSAGIQMVKTTRKISQQKAYENEIVFGTPFQAPNQAKAQKTMVASGYEEALESPGVGMLPFATHSLDSAISHYAALLSEVLNVHDAHGTGLGNFQNAARNLNHATWNALLNYSPTEQMYLALEKTVTGFAEVLSRPDTSPEVVAAVKAAIQGMMDGAEYGGSVGMFLTETMFQAKKSAYEADKIRLGALVQMKSIDQYALEGGNYAVTNKDRAEAQKKLDEVLAAGSSISNATWEKLNAISLAVAGIPAPNLPPTTSTWGAIGESGIPSDAGLIKEFKARDGKMTVKEATTFMNQRLMNGGEATGFNKFKRQLMWRLMKSLDPNTVIKYVTPSTPESEVMSRPSNPESRAWVSVDGKTGKAEIYVLSAEHKFSGFTEESLMHEMVHAAVTLAIAAGQKPGAKGAAAELVQSLEALRQGAEFFINSDTGGTLKAEFGHMVANIDELVAWGMTNQDFQDKVLKNIKSQSKMGSIAQKLRDGLTVLIGIFTNYLFGDVTPEQNNGMVTLITDVSALFKAADEITNKDRQQPSSFSVKEDLIEKLEEALNAADAIDAFGSSSNNPDAKKLINAVISTTEPITLEVSRLISGMQTYGTDYAIDLQNRLQDILSSPKESQSEDMIVLYKDAVNYKNEFNRRQQSLPMTFSQAYAAPINKVNSYSTADLYSALDKGKVSPAFNEQLKDLLNGIVEKLHGPFGSFKASLMQNQTLTPMDVWLKALDTGKAPFASSALTAGFKISDQEAFVLEQVEATVKAAMTDNAGQTTAVYSELRRLYAEAERRLKPTDFADPALYDFLFKVEAGKGNQSDYLSRFAALGLTHEGVSTLLQFNTERDTRSLVDAKTLLDKLRYLFDKALTLLNGKLTHTTEGMRADDKLKTLVEQLVDIEAKKRRQLLKQDPSFLAPVANMADSATNAVRKKIVDLANSGPVQNSKNGLVKFAGTAVSITANNQVGAVMAGIQKMRDQHFKEKNGLLMGMANELRGPKSWLEKLLRMRKKQEQDRKHVITETAKSINESFGRKLKSEEKSAVTAMFLRTGMHSLLGKYDMSQIHELVEDRNALNSAIKDREAQLNEFPDYQHYFTFQAKALAHHRTNGEVKSALLMMNAGNIAKLYGTAHVGKMSVAQTTRAEEIIDQLTTLYAMKYVDPKHIGPAKAVMRDEMLRNATMNGVEMVLTLHKALENESKATLFEGSEALMMKGHTPEIYNPHTDVRIATTAEEMREAKLEGYVSYGALQQDATDTVLPGGVIMVLKDGGLQPWQSGAVSFRGRQAKGSKLHSGYNNPFHESGVQNTAMSSNMARAKQSAIASMFQPNPGFNPSAEKRNFMAPIMSANGTVSNWRYLMNDQLKDNALERDSSVDQVLGMLAGSMFDKQTANTVNVQVIHALKEHFNAEYKYSPSSFVKIAHDSPDAEMRDVYAMLPKETRDEISKVWGREGLRVPYEMLDIVFGYRKASLSTVWEKEKTNLMETALIMAVESSLYQYARIRLGMSADDAEDYSKRGAVIMRRAENIWQEVVRETKDTIVVKTGTVMLDNIVSNISLLKIHGVSPSDLIKHHRVAFKAARAYQQDKSKVFQLEQKLSLGMLTPEDARKASRELVMLEDAIARNPVLPLIDAGLMPTIVEDVSQDDDPYTYKSQLTRKLKEYGEKVNPMVMTAAKGVYMTHDTAPYKFLSQATQLSDFVARYTLYQHLTTKKDKPLSHEAAIQAASDSFINYDVPMHKTMQYLDDAGIVPFMKYALRIQRVLYRLAKEKPAAVLSMVLLGNMFESLPLVTDSGMVNRLGNNPFQWGAFKYPTTLDQLATVNGALSLVK